MNVRILILAVVYFLFPLNGFAHVPTPLHVSIGKVTEVVFPQKISKVIKGGSPDSVLVEVLDNCIYILPKTVNPSDIFVTDVTGESYPLNLQLAAEHDIRIDVQGPNLKVTPSEGKLNPLDLMKQVLLGQEPAGATILRGGQTILENSQIRLTVDKIYDLPNIRAYVLKGENLTQADAVVPIQQIVFPNLLAITADQDVLKPSGQEGSVTFLYMLTSK